MAYEDDFGGYEPYEDDLEALGEREAWEDSQAEMADDEEGDDDDEEDSIIDRFDQQAESVLYPWLDSDVMVEEF